MKARLGIIADHAPELLIDVRDGREMVRRAVVGELTAAGLSTRTIAPVVGTSHMSVQRDVEAGVTPVTPEPTDVVDADLIDDAASLLPNL